jgi:hypothetical protein
VDANEEEAMTRTVLVAAVIICMCCVVPTRAAEQTTDGFLAELQRPASVARFTIDPEHYSRLTQEDQRSVLMAKEVLRAFFRELATVKGGLDRYLTKDYRERTHGGRALRSELLSEESSLLQVGVSDFQLSDEGRALRLEFFALLLAEGTFTAGQGNASMVMTDGVWKISAISVSK